VNYPAFRLITLRSGQFEQRRYGNSIISFPILPLISKDPNTVPGVQDSGSDADQISDMDSIMSSNHAHRYGKRRSTCYHGLAYLRYHGMSNNPYPLPNDELEKDRLDALQTCFHLLLSANIVAPVVKSPRQISFDSSIVKSNNSRCWNRLGEVGHGSR
jgi:hypothetical protein